MWHAGCAWCGLPCAFGAGAAASHQSQALVDRSTLATPLTYDETMDRLPRCVVIRTWLDELSDIFRAPGTARSCASARPPFVDSHQADWPALRSPPRDPNGCNEVYLRVPVVARRATTERGRSVAAFHAPSWSAKHNGSDEAAR